MLQLYNKNTTDFSGIGIVLEKASDVKIKEVINGEYLLSFSFPPQMRKCNILFLMPLQRQKINFSKQRVLMNRGILQPLTTHIFLLIQLIVGFIPLFQHYGVSPSTVLNAVLTDTPFSVGTVEIDTLTDIVLSKTNPMEVISKLVENVGGGTCKRQLYN